MKICPNCRNQNPDQAAFCLTCGTNLNNPYQPTNQPTNQPINQPINQPTYQPINNQPIQQVFQPYDFPPQEQNKKPIYKRVWFWIIAIAIVIGAIANAPSQNSKKDNTTNSSNTTESQTDTSSTTSEAESTIANNNKSFDVGDTSEFDNFELTVNSFSFENQIKSSQYTAFTPDEGNKYIVINMTIKNIGKGANTFYESYALTHPTTIKIIYDNDYEFSSTNLLGLSDDLHDETLNPLATLTGILAFEAPQEVVDSNGSLTLVLQKGSKKISYKLR